MDRKQDNSNICNKNESRMKEKTSSEGSDKRRVNLGVWAPKFGRSFAIWQFGRTFGFPKSENYEKQHSHWFPRAKNYTALL